MSMGSALLLLALGVFAGMALGVVIGFVWLAVKIMRQCR